MKKKDAKPVARMACLDKPGCTERAAVYQNTRHYLYTRCPACKCNQDNSAARQVRVWQHMEPIDGAVLHRPRNVPASAGEPGCALSGQAPAVAVVEQLAAEPAPEPIAAGAAPEPAPEPAVPAGAAPEKTPEKPGEKPKERSGGLFWGVVAVISLTAAGITAALTSPSTGGNT